MRFHNLHELDATEGTVQLRRSTGDASALVLVPRPSATDPNDPLRWPWCKKHVAFLAVCSFTFLTSFGIGGLAPAFYLLSLEFGKSMAEMSDLLVWPILILGLFNFLWVPLANYLGKRPVFVFCSCLLTLAYVWGAVAGSFASLLWSNIVAAFAGSATEALAASIVNDLFFLHERGAKMGLYTNFIAGGNTVGPLVCGFIITGLSWRWHKWLSVILSALTFLTVLFFVPETRYFRGDDDQNVATSGRAGTPASLSTEKVLTTELTNPVAVAQAHSTHPVYDDTKNPVCDDTKDDNPEAGVSGPSGPGQRDPAAAPAMRKKTFVQQLSLFSGLDRSTGLALLFVRPFPMFLYPCVAYAFLGYAVSLVVTVAVNILNPFVLQAAPYGWSPMINGLINIPGLVGNVLGSYAGGWLVDVYCDRRARRNAGGVFEPEGRLHLLVLPLLVTGAGCVLFGYGVGRALHWTSLFLGYGMVSFALTAVPTVTMAYVSDCLLPVNADALMLVNGSKNIVAFGFLYGIIPWVTKAGYVDCFGAQAGIFVAVLAVGMAILIPFGGRIRHAQAHWRIILRS